MPSPEGRSIRDGRGRRAGPAPLPQEAWHLVTQEPAPRPSRRGVGGAAARRWSLGSLWRGYRAELWGTEEFRSIFAATEAGWFEKEVLLGGMGNAVNGSLRV